MAPVNVSHKNPIHSGAPGRPQQTALAQVRHEGLSPDLGGQWPLPHSGDCPTHGKAGGVLDAHFRVSDQLTFLMLNLIGVPKWMS